MRTASLAYFKCAEKNGKRSSRSWIVASFLRMSSMVFAGILISLAVLTGCSSDSDKTTEPAKPEVKGPELLDARPYRIESIATSDGTGHDGKWAVWRGGFASATQRAAKTYIWSGSAADGAPSRGINPGIEDSYSATNASMQTWDIQFLKIDSDQALATAQKHGGDKVLEKSPDTPVMYVCDFNKNTNKLIWHVIFGSGRENSKLTVSVDASTGDFIRVEK